MIARRNPFATERMEQLLCYNPTWIGRSWEEILSSLEELDWCAAVIGPHGSGKTTLLDELARRMETNGTPVRRLFLNDAHRRLDGLEFADPNEIVFLDGAEQLSGWAWRRFRRAVAPAKGVVITSHRPGRLPTLLKTKVSPEILRCCVNRLDPDFVLSEREAEALFVRHDGNIRHALLECYDRASQANSKM